MSRITRFLSFVVLILATSSSGSASVNEYQINNPQSTRNQLAEPYRFSNDLNYVKDELVAIKQSLIAVQNSHNPSLIKQSMETASSTIKELLLIGLSAILVGSVTCGVGVLFSQVLENMPEQIKLATLLCGAPILFVALLVTYATLKGFFHLVSGKKTQSPEDLKELLKALEKTIAQLNYALRAIENA